MHPGSVWIGIGLEIVAAALGTVSKQLIAFAQFHRARFLNALGITINVLIGPLVDASAYAFAPQTVVAPFASLDVLFNAISAPITLRWQEEQLTKRHIAAALLVTCGASLSAVFGTVTTQILTAHEFMELLLQPRALLYLCAEFVGVVVVISMLRLNMFSKQVKGVALGGIAGCLMGNVFFLKGFVGILRLSFSSGDWSDWASIIPYLLLCAAAAGSILGTIFMQRALKEFKGVYIVTIFEGSHIVMACLSGSIVMDEMKGVAWQKYICYWASVSLVVAGIQLMNHSTQEAEVICSGTPGASFLLSFHNSQGRASVNGSAFARSPGFAEQDISLQDMEHVELGW